jgi:hypothetical protein
MIVLATARVSVDAAKKSKARKQLVSQKLQEKRESESQAETFLKKEKTDTLKSIAVNYVQSQQKALEDLEKKKQQEKENNIKIGVATGIGVIIVGIIAYKVINK